MNLRNLIDRIRTVHARSIVTETDEGIEVSLAGDRLVVKTSGKRVSIVRGSVTRHVAPREADDHVMDALNEIWHRHLDAQPKRESSGGCSSGYSRGGDDDLVVGEPTILERDVDDDDD